MPDKEDWFSEREQINWWCVRRIQKTAIQSGFYRDIPGTAIFRLVNENKQCKATKHSYMSILLRAVPANSFSLFFFFFFFFFFTTMLINADANVMFGQFINPLLFISQTLIEEIWRMSLSESNIFFLLLGILLKFVLILMGFLIKPNYRQTSTT